MRDKPRFWRNEPKPGEAGRGSYLISGFAPRKRSRPGRSRSKACLHPVSNSPSTRFVTILRRRYPRRRPRKLPWIGPVGAELVSLGLALLETAGWWLILFEVLWLRLGRRRGLEAADWLPWILLTVAAFEHAPRARGPQWGFNRIPPSRKSSARGGPSDVEPAFCGYRRGWLANPNSGS